MTLRCDSPLFLLVFLGVTAGIPTQSMGQEEMVVGQKPTLYNPANSRSVHPVHVISIERDRSLTSNAAASDPASFCKPNFHYEPSSFGPSSDGSSGTCVYVYSVPAISTTITYSYTADSKGDPVPHGGTSDKDPEHGQLTERVSHSDGRATLNYQDNFYRTQEDLNAGIALANAEHDLILYAKKAPNSADGFQLQFIVAN